MGAEVVELVRSLQPDLHVDRPGRIVEDTSQFMRIGAGDVIRLEGRHYLVHREAIERGPMFEEVKHWVKKCRELESGEPKLLKLVFHESFLLGIGCVEVRFHRSARKEARILELVGDDPRFMHGMARHDAAGNLVRVIDMIRGKRIDAVVDAVQTDHETWFHDHFPAVLRRFVAACEAIAFLHDHGERHGDICRDHLWREHGTGDYRWIDFDYAVQSSCNPFAMDVFRLASLLVLIVGKRDWTPAALAETGMDERLAAPLEPGDFSAVHRNRIVNLGKLFPYIPRRLVHVCMRLSAASDVAYESVAELLDDLAPCLDLLPEPSNPEVEPCTSICS